MWRESQKLNHQRELGGVWNSATSVYPGLPSSYLNMSSVQPCSSMYDVPRYDDVDGTGQLRPACMCTWVEHRDHAWKAQQGSKTPAFPALHLYQQ